MKKLDMLRDDKAADADDLVSRFLNIKHEINTPLALLGPLAWNQLPASLRNMNCIATFKRHLKTILFKAAYGVADN